MKDGDQMYGIARSDSASPSPDFRRIEQQHLDGAWDRIDSATTAREARLQEVTETGTPLWERLGAAQEAKQDRLMLTGSAVVGGALIPLGGVIGLMASAGTGAPVKYAAAGAGLGLLVGSAFVGAMALISRDDGPPTFDARPVDDPDFETALALQNEHTALIRQQDRLFSEDLLPRTAEAPVYSDATLGDAVQQLFADFDRDRDGAIRIDVAGKRPTNETLRTTDGGSVHLATVASLDDDLQPVDTDDSGSLSPTELANALAADEVRTAFTRHQHQFLQDGGAFDEYLRD